MKEKIRFSDLSGSLKTAIVFLWILIGIYGLSFLIGFIYGVWGAL